MTATAEPGETVEPGDRSARVVVVRRLPGFDPAAPVIPAPRQPADTGAPAPPEPAGAGGVEIDPAYVRLVLRMVLEVLRRRRPPAHLAVVLGVRARRYVAAMTGRLGDLPPAGPGRRRPGSTPTSGRPVNGTPTSSTPTSGRPVSGTPTSSTPTSGRPVSGTPADSTPVSGSPAGWSPAVGSPVSGPPAGGSSMRGPVHGRLGGGLHTVRISSPADGIAEVSAVWADRNRYRALAARFERHQPDPAAPPRWSCTELRLG